MTYVDKIESLAKLEKEYNEKCKKPAGLWGMINSIHAVPELRQWVTLESVPLLPFVEKKAAATAGQEPEAVVHLLLAVPGKAGERLIVLPPWGYISWHWPSGRLLARFKISDFITLSGVELSAEYICTKKYADGIAKALAGDSEPPLPPEPLLDVYNTIMPLLPAHKESSSMPTGSTKNTGVAATPLPDQMTRAKKIIRDEHDEQFLREWRRIYTRMNEPFFSVAVVGEFSRGKSTLINMLLDSEILPVGGLPTTAMVTRILYGDRPLIRYIHADGKKEILPLSPESWDSLVADDAGHDPEGVVEVEYPSEWLKKTGIQIIDTPGAGDLTGRRASLTIEAIASCDASLVASSAVMALSLTEKSFIQQHVLARKIPRVAVVLTRLDQISEQERSAVVNYVKNKLARWAPGVPLWSSYAAPVLPDESIVAAAGPEQILNQLAAWAANDEHIQLKGRQIGVQLYDLLTLMKINLQTKIDAARLSRQKRQEEIQNARQALERARLEWEDLRIEMEKKANRCGAWMEESLLKSKNSIVEKLQYELRHTANPKSWWEQDFPYRLRVELAGLGRGLEDALQRKIAGDAAWLEAQLKDKLSWSMPVTGTNPIVELTGEQGTYSKDDLNDLNRTRLISRLGFGAATFLGFILFGPLGMAVSIGGGIVSEKIFSDSVEKQKQELSKAIEQVVHKVIVAAANTSIKRLRAAYRALLRETQKQESAWFKARCQALDSDAGELPDILPQTAKNLKQTEELLGELLIWTTGGVNIASQPKTKRL